MNKTLKIIQIVAKVGHIVYKVGFIISIVAAAGCLIAAITLAAGLGTVDVVNNILGNFIDISAEETEEAIASASVSLIGVMIMMAASIVNCYLTQRYFANELAAGTPFTTDGANEMFRLGIVETALGFAVPITAGILCNILAGILHTNWENDVNNGGAITAGIILMFLSILLRYGAERTNNDEGHPTSDAVETTAVDVTESAYNAEASESAESAESAEKTDAPKDDEEKYI